MLPQLRLRPVAGHVVAQEAVAETQRLEQLRREEGQAALSRARSLAAAGTPPAASSRASAPSAACFGVTPASPASSSRAPVATD